MPFVQITVLKLTLLSFLHFFLSFHGIEGAATPVLQKKIAEVSYHDNPYCDVLDRIDSWNEGTCFVVGAFTDLYDCPQYEENCSLSSVYDDELSDEAKQD